MRALKALVFGMGVLIVAGVVFLLYAIIDKSGEKTALGLSGLQAEVALPAGAEVVETSVGDGMIVLRLRLADGAGRLLVIDPATGNSRGRIDLKTQ